MRKAPASAGAFLFCDSSKMVKSILCLHFFKSLECRYGLDGLKGGLT